MAPRSVLSPEERDFLIREARQDGGQARATTSPEDSLSSAGGTRIPVRTVAGGGRGPAKPPSRRPPGRGDSPRGLPQGPVAPPPRRRRWRLTLALIVLLLVILGAGIGNVLSVGTAVLSPERSILGQLTDLLFGRGGLDGEHDNRINILLAAVGGEGHQGENLADTVILASFRPQEKDVALLSVPRDLYVKIPDTDVYARLNAVHAYGESTKRGNGLDLLRRKVGEMSGQPVHYVARVDFIAFKRIVEEIGGIDVTIHDTFYDYWHRINFPAGTEHMNGERALAYVRARFVEGPEGGDFKRAARTQQVLLAIRKKVLSLQTAVDLRALAGVLDALKENVATNFTLRDLKRLADLSREIPDGNIHTAVLTTGPDGLLVGTTEILGGRPASVLRPRAGLEQYGEIQTYVADIFSKARTATPPPEPLAAAPPAAGEPPAASPQPLTVGSEQPTVDVRNGTAVTGLAARVAKVLEKKEYTIAAVGNAGIRNRTTTIVVDRTGGKKPASLKVLLDALGISTAVNLPPGEKETTDASFIVFLGADVAERFKR